MRRFVARALLVSSLVGLLPASAVAGPQLLCFPMVIDSARSLPWGQGGWNSPDPTYDLAKLATDTVGLLAQDSPVLVRMETLRRAVIYAAQDRQAAGELFAALRARVAKPAPGASAALAQFDLGYGIEAFRQTRHSFPHSSAVAPSDDGYALIKQALAARGPDPAMEYAAALVASGRSFRAVADEHLRRASAGAPVGSALARTIAAHQPIWAGRVAPGGPAAGR
jgi:hypothetical protein